MRVTTRFVLVLVLVVSSFLGSGCSSDPQGAPAIPADDVVVRFDNVRPDSLQGWAYLSLDSMRVVDPATSAWDLRLPYILCCGRSKSIPIQLNSGTNGRGSVTGVVVNGRFETVTGLPSGVSLRSDDTTKPVVPLVVLGGEAFFIYDLSSHTLRPSPDKTLLVRSSGGGLFKVSVTSIYRDAESNPTLDTPIGFYHFRVAKLKQ